MENKKVFELVDGKFVVKFEAKHDGDQDGVVAAKAGAFAEIDAVEAVKELIKAQHKPSLDILIPWIQNMIKDLPDYQKA